MYRNPLFQNDPSYRFNTAIIALGKNLRDKGWDFNFCFALQGDNSVTDEEFEDQKKFVDLTVSILSPYKHGNFCAVQYGKKIGPISPLTSGELQFLRDLGRQKRVGGTSTNIGPALRHVASQFPARERKNNKLIILGDNFMSDDFVPKLLPWKLRTESVDLYIVAIGGLDFGLVKNLVQGDVNKVIEIDDFFELEEIIIGLLIGVCGFYDTHFF